MSSSSISSWPESSSRSESKVWEWVWEEWVWEWESSTGIFADAEVEGLRSWVGEGARLRETDWRALPSSMAGLEEEAAIVVIVVWLLGGEGACVVVVVMMEMELGKRLTGV